jgi:hypothetical protein
MLSAQGRLVNIVGLCAGWEPKGRFSSNHREGVKGL